MTELPPNPKQAFGDLKVPVALVPPAAVIYAGLAFKEGARKYGPYNWREKSVEAMTYVNATMRHLMAWQDREEDDPDSGNPHLAHALACLAILVDSIEIGNLLDNRPLAGSAGTMLKRYEKSKASDEPPVQAPPENEPVPIKEPEVTRREPRPLNSKFDHACPDLDQEFQPCTCHAGHCAAEVLGSERIYEGRRRGAVRVQCVRLRTKDDKRFDVI